MKKNSRQKTKKQQKIISFEQMAGFISKNTKQPIQNAVSLRAKMEKEYIRV